MGFGYHDIVKAVFLFFYLPACVLRLGAFVQKTLKKKKKQISKSLQLWSQKLNLQLKLNVCSTVYGVQLLSDINLTSGASWAPYLLRPSGWLNYTCALTQPNRRYCKHSKVAAYCLPRSRRETETVPMHQRFSFLLLLGGFFF